MRVRRPIWLLACAVFVGCASSEGGVTGTGISAVSGNVVMVSDQQAPPSSAALPFAIHVTIDEFPGITGSTDADGTFQLDGAFSGTVTLRFAKDDGTELGPLPLEIPDGSQTVAENIEIHLGDPLPDRVRPQAVRQFDVFGRADLVECNADGSGTVLLTDVGLAPRQFMVTLTADTDIAAGSDDSLTCADIVTGGAIEVSGLLRRDDQTLVAVSVAVAARRPPQPGPSPRPERLRGTVQGVDCQHGLIAVAQRSVADPVERLIRLTEQTMLECPSDSHATCDCSAIAVGQPIAVAGTIFPARPGQVRADVVILGVTTLPVDLTGTIIRLACAIGGLGVLSDAGQGIRVAFTAATDIRCAGDVPCGCTDLRVREHVRVVGQRPPDGGPVTADRIAVLTSRARVAASGSVSSPTSR